MTKLPAAIGLAAILAGCEPLPPTPPPNYDAMFPIQVGKASTYRRYSELHVLVRNATDRPVRFLKITCAFNDKAGAFAASGVGAAMDLQPGASIAVQVPVDGTRYSSVSCTPSPTY